MRVLLVTTVNKLAEKFAALSPELEYCAIVIDDVELAKKILNEKVSSTIPFYPMSELKTCVESFNYDYIVPVQNRSYHEEVMDKLLPKYNVPQNKVVSFSELHSLGNFKTDRVLRYYQEHSHEFEMFITGISTAYRGIDVTRFKRKCFNFATSSQDLYYNYNVAKFAICIRGGA